MKSIKRFLAVILSCCMMMTMATVTFAQDTVVTTNDEVLSVSSDNCAEFPSDRTVKITKPVTIVAYTASCTGNTGVVILRFTNRTTGEVRNHTFLCDNVYHNRETLGNAFSTGTWDISLVTSTCGNFVSIFMNFR